MSNNRVTLHPDVANVASRVQDRLKLATLSDAINAIVAMEGQRFLNRLTVDDSASHLKPHQPIESPTKHPPQLSPWGEVDHAIELPGSSDDVVTRLADVIPMEF